LTWRFPWGDRGKRETPGKRDSYTLKQVGEEIKWKNLKDLSDAIQNKKKNSDGGMNYKNGKNGK